MVKNEMRCKVEGNEILKLREKNIKGKWRRNREEEIFFFFTDRKIGR